MSNTKFQTVIARQAIFDSDLNLYAYELLYRGDLRVDESILMGDSATNQVINNTFVDFGLENVVGEHIAFINMTRNLLIKGNPLPYSHDKVILEILEDITVDEELITAVEKLVGQGYKIALDDFIFKESLWPLIKLASIVKIDILLLNPEELKEHVSLLKKEGIQILAEKVETQHQYEQCKALGVDYFQGYFFSKPSLINNPHKN